jgi:hypothetical protein
MAQNSANAVVANAGAVSIGATTAAAPTGASTALSGTDWTDLGFISDDGITETKDQSTSTITAWQNAATVRESVTDASLTYTFTMIETNKTAVGLYYGTTVNATDGSVVVVPASTGGRRSFVIDVIDGTSLIRTYIPSGEVTKSGDKVYKNGEVVGYEVTVSAYSGTYGSGGTAWSGAAKIWHSQLVSA